MDNNKFGYSIHADNQINLDEGDFSLLQKIMAEEPGINNCISCGSCSASCTAASFTDFNFRKLCQNVRRGQINRLMNELSKCMFCGKCQLVCPRGINTRKVISLLHKELSKTRQYAY